MSAKYFKSLLFKSAQIQQEIESENQRRWPDWMRLLKLKKLRLSIKDRLARLMKSYNVHILEPAKSRSMRIGKKHLQGV